MANRDHAQPDPNKKGKQPSKSSEKDARRRQKALDKEFEKRTKERARSNRSVSPPLTSILDLSLPTRAPRPSAPGEGTSSTAQISQPSQSQVHDLMKEWMSDTIRKAIAEGVQQGLAARQVTHSEWERRSEASLQSFGSYSHPYRGRGDIRHEPDDMGVRTGDDSASSLELDPPLGRDEDEEEGAGDDEEDRRSQAGMSDDGTLTPNQPTFTGLFKPELFRSLLFKAKTTARLQKSPPHPSTDDDQAEDLFFSQPVNEVEEVPVPKMFFQLLEKQWVSTSQALFPSRLDKRIYNIDAEYAKKLAIPCVDEPVAALVSQTPSSAEPEEALKPEDKRLEMALRRAHQADAWAIRASTTASFFARASLRWLRHLGENISPDNLRAHQDLAKVTAATEFVADATFNSVRFSAKATSAQVAARRHLWLRHWQADLKTKAKLASAPVSSDLLFGSALDPFLIESRNKRKILPSLSRRSERTFQPFRASSFRPYGQSSFPNRYHSQSSFRGTPHGPRPDTQERPRRGSQGRKPFRGSTSRGFRKSK